MITVRTAADDLELRQLCASDVEDYYALVDANRAHLHRHGDYAFERDATLDGIRDQFAAIPDTMVAFGIRYRDELAGRIDLIRYTPARYGVGYWLGEAYTGRGFATSALTAVIAYARDDLGATDMFAGITKGNAASVAVVTRVGFAEVATFDTYDRYHLTLTYPAQSTALR